MEATNAAPTLPPLTDPVTLQLGDRIFHLHCTLASLRRIEQEFGFDALVIGRLVDEINTKNIGKLMFILYAMIEDPGDLKVGDLLPMLSLRQAVIEVRTAIDIAFRRSYGMPDEDEDPAEDSTPGEAPANG